METRTEFDAADAAPSRAQRFARRPWYTRAFVVVGAVTAIAAGLRFYHLSTPPQLVFDETYYAKDGCLDAGYPFQACKLESAGEQTFSVHPPLGRELIALGERIWGNRPFGWRVGSATFGTASVFLLAVLAYRMFGSSLWAGAAGILLAAESLNFVQSRISMLDIYVTGFVVGGFLFLVLDRQWIERRVQPPEPLTEEEAVEAALLNLPPDRPASPVFRPWRLAAGVALGAALATKWSGGPALVAAILLSYAWERGRRRQVRLVHPIREAIRDESFGIFLFLVLVPLAVYMASYARYFVDSGFNLPDWWSVQAGMASYSIRLRAEHPYASDAWTWIFLARPVAYYYACTRTVAGQCVSSAEILGIGNPVIFWGSLVALPYCLAAWVAKRDWRAGLIVVAFTLQYVPWFFATRTSFLFYMAPITPFMVLAVVYILRDLAELRMGSEGVRVLAPISAGVVIAAVVLFVFFLPVLTGRSIAQDEWRRRIWFSCPSGKTCVFNWV